MPIGAYAEMKDGALHLTAVVARPDGSKVLRENQSGSDHEQLGKMVGKRLLERGGDRILQEVYGETAAAPQQP